MRDKDEILCEQNKQHLSVGEKLTIELLINIRDQLVVNNENQIIINNDLIDLHNTLIERFG